jgi:aspartate aminotransferase-like enzyme
MSQFDRIQKHIAANERAIAGYRAAGLDIYYKPHRTNDKWFVKLMEKHAIPPVDAAKLERGTVSVLMVND